MYACFLFLVLITGWSGLIGRLESIPIESDDVMFWFLTSVFVLFQIIFLLFVLNQRRVEKAKLTMGKDELRKHMATSQICCKICTAQGYDPPIAVQCPWIETALLRVNEKIPSDCILSNGAPFHYAGN